MAWKKVWFMNVMGDGEFTMIPISAKDRPTAEAIACTAVENMVSAFSCNTPLAVELREICLRSDLVTYTPISTGSVADLQAYSITGLAGYNPFINTAYDSIT